MALKKGKDRWRQPTVWVKRWNTYSDYLQPIIIPFPQNVKKGNTMKNGNVFYMELSRAIFDEQHKNMSRNAKWLFVCLNELEQRYCSNNSDRDFFMSTDKQLCDITGFSINTLKAAKAELRKTDLVDVSRGGWHYTDTGKSAISQPTVYRILR